MKRKVKMTNELATTLMDALCCVAISADGGYDETRFETDGYEGAQEYARAKFCEILNQWEEIYDFEWEIEEPKENLFMA